MEVTDQNTVLLVYLVNIWYYKPTKTRKWTQPQLEAAAASNFSIRQVLINLGLKPAGGNYFQIAKYLSEYRIPTDHFKGMGWNKGLTGIGKPRLSLDQILTTGSNFQSYKLKNRLFSLQLKKPECEECSWARSAENGRIPLELDHINGDSHDNRLENLRILCPNCHSLKPTHRGLNRSSKKTKLKLVWWNGIHVTLKMLWPSALWVRVPPPAHDTKSGNSWPNNKQFNPCCRIYIME